ncbi:AAA family ATPase [Mycoplasma marinum]|uniref:AAA+ ATPase domain-containing protein n=1 Tax=Mycoplasma marinum TaxID=1937190 RepID=A0A4R0XK78_9MOLU|nr:AAA family ATPase [Mycoplasma marinum]TCG11043.1 hypothetical protein C4B24_03095 [Mycoplasma marinum]
MFALIGVLSIVMLLISFMNKKRISFILVIVSLSFLFVIQYYHGAQFKFLKGNYWVIIISILFLFAYFIYLFKFKALGKFKKSFKELQKNIFYPTVEESFFSMVIILIINNKSVCDSFSAIILASIVFVNIRIIVNDKYTCKNIIFLFLLSITTKIQFIFSNVLFSIITHIIFNVLNSVFIEKNECESIKLLNGKIIKNKIIFQDKVNYVIHGANGVGKTTFAKMKSGLIGSETNWNNGEFNVLMQECEFDFSLDWYNECYDFGDAYDFWVEKLNFKNLSKTTYLYLSSGEKQRFKLIIALLIQPRKLFLDELENSLDPKSLKWVLETLDEFQQNNNISYIFISHKDAKIIERFKPIKISFSEKVISYE